MAGVSLQNEARRRRRRLCRRLRRRLMTSPPLCSLPVFATYKSARCLAGWLRSSLMK